MSQPQRDAEVNDWLSDYWNVGMNHQQRIEFSTRLGWGITTASYPYECLTPTQKDELWDVWCEEQDR